MRQLAPVVVFAYRRPRHLRNTLESLMRCAGFARTPVVIFGDGPRHADEMAAVEETRAVARAMLGDSAEYHFSETNQGLARSVIAGVTDVVSRYGRAIVVEDDLELAPSFLTFMNHALDRYADDEEVFQVSGYMFDVPELRDSSSAVFLPFTVSWGWATWKRAWDRFDPMATGWEALKTDRCLRHRFNLDGAYDYATMLIRQMAGLRDSWAVRWYWTVFKAQGLVLFPPTSLVRNTGFDGSGSHGRGLLRSFSQDKIAMNGNTYDMRKPVSLDEKPYIQVKAAIWRQNGRWIGRIIDTLRWLTTLNLNKPRCH